MNAAVSGLSISWAVGQPARAPQAGSEPYQFGLYFAAHLLELFNKFSQHATHNIARGLTQHALLTLKRGFDALVEQGDQLLCT